MKRFWLVLLSLGLVMAFSVSAFAVDVKVSADYYVGGLYLNKVNVDDGFNGYQGWRGSHNPSTAFFYQRLRVGTDFVISPCLKLVTQFDAMERIWGGARTPAMAPPFVDNSDEFGSGTRAEAENIAPRLVYIDYTSPVGQLKVGYLPDYVFGTAFADRGNGTPKGQIQYFIQQGPWIGFLGYAKEGEGNANYNTPSNLTDTDADSYRIAGIYTFKGGEAGLLFLWNRTATDKGYVAPTDPFGIPFLANIYTLDPYVKAKIGPVALQAEALWYSGSIKAEDGKSFWGYTDATINAYSAFVDATADLGMFYAGGSVAYLTGWDPSSDGNTIKGGPMAGNTAGLDWNPCLIMFNTETLGYWVGNMYGHSGSVVDAEMNNALFFQGRVGVKPTPQWDILLSLSYAQADKKAFINAYGDFIKTPNGTYGTEIDLTGTYKITNNLSYMLGFGYLFTGDFYKGYDASTAKVADDYILINKLTLSF